MTWDTPTYVEIKMSAEIGGYQDDFEERTPVPLDMPHQRVDEPNVDEGG